MANQVELDIIRKADEHPGLLSRAEQAFIDNIKHLPASVRLTGAQASWLYQIGERKLNMVFTRPERPAVIDLKARACA